MRPWGAVQGRQRASLRTDCPVSPGVRGGKCRPSRISRGVPCGPECGPFVIQHNATLREMGLNGPQRATCVMSAPGGEGALRVLSR
ncbi:hypothetical protein RRF79_25750, partial [Escherichia coli]|nr:hypothetical protein [Escherichia coli]MDT8660347.1 hypothetical protein [Escherichia coli]MDT8675045.1 hypothetical protein [Escherichia coli]